MYNVEKESDPAAFEHTYRNPVHRGYFADPFVLRLENRYLAYGTGSVIGGEVFEVLESTDLASWHRVGGALTAPADALGTDLWAPEVAAAAGRYWMYYSAGFDDAAHQLRVAVADSPTGPFVDQGIHLLPDERFAIDPHPFLDSDGSWYLYFARDVLDAARPGTQLAVVRLADMTTPTGPVLTVLEPSADWQLFQRQRPMYGGVYDWHTLEGPTVLHRNGIYYCLFSGGSWQTEGYGVSWAAAPSPTGPWREAVGTPRLLATVPGRVRGPGHNCVVTTFGGTDVLVYHAWNADLSQRELCIDPVRFDEDGPHTAGPTWTDQPLPG